jgi:hypothetical protein
MRSDPATHVFGIRFNALLSAALCVIATVWFVRLARRPEPVDASTGMSDEDHTVDEPDLGAPTS